MRALPEILQQLPTSVENGLAPDAVEASRQRFGANRLTPLPQPPLWRKFLEKFDEPIILILLLAALLSMVVDLFRPPFEQERFLAGGIAVGLALLAAVGAWALRRDEWLPTILFAAALVLWPVGLATGHASYDGLAVMVAVLLATGVAFLSEYKSDREFELLNARKELTAKVLRGGEFHTVPMEEVVVGDVLILEMGDEITADGRLVRSHELYVDQSLMTGESEPAHKRPQPVEDTADGPEQPGCLYRGTQVVDGVGQMMVTEVGDATYLGQIARRLSAEEDEAGEPVDAGSRFGVSKQVRVRRKLTVSKEATPLQQKLERLARLISKVGYVAAVAIFLALLTRGILRGELRWPGAEPRPPAADAAEQAGAPGVRRLALQASAAVAYSADGRRVAVAVDNIVTVLDGATLLPVGQVEVPGGKVCGLALSTEGDRLAVGSGDGEVVREVTVWDPVRRERLHGFTGPWDWRIAFSRDLKHLATADARSRAVEIWDVTEGKRLHTLAQRAHLHTRLAFGPDGQRLATTGLERQDRVRTWDVATGKLLARFPQQKELIRDVAFSPDGKQLAESGTGAVLIRDAATGQELLAIRSQGESFIDSLCYGGDRLAATVSTVSPPSQQVVIWDARTGAEVAAFPDAVKSLALSPDGRFLAGNGADGKARLWPVEAAPPAAPAPESPPHDDFWSVLFDDAGHLLRYFMYMVIIIVVAVPEGLPMSVTISLALAMRKMTRANSLVRQLVACETIGSATVICSDKTGTLTQNKMQVARLGFDSQSHDRGSAAWPALLADCRAQVENAAVRSAAGWMVLNAAVNSTANLEEKDGRLVPVGNSTEGALLLWLHEFGLDYEELRRRFPPLYQIHFSSERKRMATVICYPPRVRGQESGVRGQESVDRGQGTGAGQEGEDSSLTPVPWSLTPGLLVLVKGAPEWLLAESTHYQAADGRPRAWTPAARAAARAQLQAASAQAMRTLAFGHTCLPADTPTDEDALHARRDSLERDLVYVGFVAIRDPLREDVKDAVNECRQAGIEVVMITGDNVETARAIGHEIGLVDRSDAPIDTPDAAVLTSEAFNQLPDEELKARLPRLRVVARARPLDKYRLVRLFQERQEVVAVTGDGTNDAPALKRADVGLAMGRSGTEVAKEASKIVLLDDAFSTIVKAVHWGRSLYENIQRFLQFQLTINVSALAIAFLGPFLGVKPPFTILQLLWINVIMDTFAAIALCSEPPRPGLMAVPPKRRDESILTRSMLITIFSTAAFFVVVMIGLLLAMEYGQLVGPASHRSAEFPELTVWQVSVFFTVYVLFQVWNEINCRSLVPEVSGLRGLFRNPTFLGIVGLTVLGQVLIVSLGGAVFQVAPLRLIDWLAIAAGTASVLVFAEVTRRIRLLVRAG